MRRALATAFALAAVGALALLAGGAAGEPSGRRYWVELDNAFGLIEGADVKVAGVRAGKITAMEVDPRTYRARVGIEISQRGFGSLRSDVFCESRPQSLIGEYFIDCLPGTSKQVLEPGSTIPVERTGSTVPVDLVNNIMRRPYRERFRILLTELGAGLAARGEDLNEAIRRANPALRETDRVLAVLAEQRKVIRDLTDNADTVLAELADNRKEVSRFVLEARDTARASAARADGIRAQFQRLPTFLSELRPTMAALGQAADRQAGALANLDSQATRLERFFDALGPFSDASRPAFRTLGSASRTGRRAVAAATPTIRQLREFATQAPELANNLAIVLEDLDSRDRAVEKDARSPGGKGFTGLEALLQYVYNQSQAINLFDGNSYILKVSAFLDSLCAAYTNAEQAKDKARDRCAAILGPNRPGINQPDPSKTAKPAARPRSARERADTPAGGEGPAAGSGPGAGAPAGAGAAPTPELPDSIRRVLEGLLPSAAPLQGAGGRGGAADLLDFLLAP